MAPYKKTMLFVCLLVAAAAVVVPAVAQGGAGVLDPLFRKLVEIRGILFCSVNLSASVGPSGIIVSPPLSSVTVQLRCGPGNGTVVSTAITSSTGEFFIFLDKFTYPVTQLLDECRLLVATPIAKCNATRPSVGALTSNLIPNGTVSLGFVRVPVLTATGFHCVALTG